MNNNFKLTYNIDIVFCIDATGSMGGIIDKVKANAINFYSDLKAEMGKKGKEINTLRAKVIAYRDYKADHKEAMMATSFFELPAQSMDFNDTIRSIKAKGGGDEPEDGLEAVAFAIRSKWNKEGIKKRHIIVVWSDASTHDLGFASDEENYPKDMAKDFSELTSWWGGVQNDGYMDYNAKRLLLFTPDKPAWTDIANSWDNVVHFPSQAGNGLKEIDYSQILDVIANSI